MAAVEVPPSAGASRARPMVVRVHLPGGSRVATVRPGGLPPVPAPVVDSPRSDEELAREWLLLQVLVGVMTDRPERPFEDLAGWELCALGVEAAALWTLGRTEVAPATRRAAVRASLREVATELEVATRSTNAGGPAWEFACGVVAWLVWLLGGGGETVQYLPVA